MVKRTPQCGIIDGRSSTWHVQNCSLLKVEIRGEYAITCLKSLALHRSLECENCNPFQLRCPDVCLQYVQCLVYPYDAVSPCIDTIQDLQISAAPHVNGLACFVGASPLSIVFLSDQ